MPATIATAWKAVVAFLAPGLLLLLEPLLLGDQELQGYDVRRALIVAAVTSAVVYLKRNGVSSDPTTSTPEVDRGSADPVLLAILVVLVLILLVIAGVLSFG